MTQRFNLGEWVVIHGKTFPETNTPAQIARERRLLLGIPADHTSNIPPASLAISLLLSMKLPPLLVTTPTGSHPSPFSPEIPEQYVDLTRLSPPPLHHTKQLLASFNQAWFDGMQSVKYPGDDTMRLPFWILEYWLRMGHAIVAKSRWEAAHQWLLAHQASIHPLVRVVHDALESFQSVGWDVKLRLKGVELHSLELVELLSNGMVDGRLVDAMIESIADRVRLDPDLQHCVSVQDLSFSDTLRLNDERWKQYNHDRCFTHARNLGDRLHDGSLDLLVIPLNINNIHWAVLFVNGPGKWIKYGDTLEWSWPVQDIERIQQWLRLHAFPSFRKAGDLEHGRQLDTYSCAIGMINIIAHNLFSDPLFTDHDKHFLRIQEYLKILQFSSSISTLSPISSDDGFQSDSDMVIPARNSPTVKATLLSSKPTIKATTTPSSLVPDSLKKSRAIVLKATPEGHNSGLLKFFQPISREQYLQVSLDDMRATRRQRADEIQQAVQDAAMTKIEKKERRKMLARDRKRAQRARAKAKAAVSEPKLLRSLC